MLKQCGVLHVQHFEILAMPPLQQGVEQTSAILK